jgi:hypothetical protein
MKKRKTLAGRVIRKILVWLLFVAVGLAFVVFYFEGNATREFYSEIYHNKMLIINEYTRRVISDVYVAVTNNIYYLEHTLDRPDDHKLTMKRIVESGTRVRSCGISFIRDYYPEKGHRFCPYSWRNSKDRDIIYTIDMGDAGIDYLKANWFIDIIESDSAQWSEPFYDGQDMKTPLSAYMVPIHDEAGHTIAVLGADISLDWLTGKLNEMDSTLNNNAMLMASKFGLKSSSFIINHDGLYITNNDPNRIMKGNFYSLMESCEGSDVESLIDDMKAGVAREDRYQVKYIVDGVECYVFYTPVKYTKWLMVTIVPCSAIEVLAMLNGAAMYLIVLLAMLVILVVSYYYIKNGLESVKRLTNTVTDMANGKFDTPLPEMKHNDEISQLRDAIENLQYTVSNYAEGNMKEK